MERSECRPEAVDLADVIDGDSEELYGARMSATTSAGRTVGRPPSPNVEPVSEAAEAPLRGAVGAALSRDVLALDDVQHDALDYDAFLAHRAVSRIHGTALVDRERIPWSMIEKTTEGPHLAVPYLTDNGEREYQAYASGMLGD